MSHKRPFNGTRSVRRARARVADVSEHERSARGAGWLRSYQRAWLRADVIAGVVIWSVVTPQAVAYAQIAGLRRRRG
jgi:hypothetical protein